MKVIKFFTVLVFISILVACSNKKAEAPKMIDENIIEVINDKPAELSLFNRLGGAEGISSIVDGIMEAHLVNPEIEHVFSPIANDPVRLQAFNKHVKEFLSAGTGGGAIYSGKDLPTAHKGLNTTEKEFMSAVDDILMVLGNHNIDEETKKDMLYILYSLKGAVIGL